MSTEQALIVLVVVLAVALVYLALRQSPTAHLKMGYDFLSKAQDVLASKNAMEAVRVETARQVAAVDIEQLKVEAADRNARSEVVNRGRSKDLESGVPSDIIAVREAVRAAGYDPDDETQLAAYEAELGGAG
jgi:alkylhydroperoxidase family enzyme